MPGQFDLQPSFPIAGVADLIASRTQKEAAMRAQQQQQLVQGLQGFGQGVQSLVDRRNQMAQALTLGKNLGMAPEEVQGLTPEQVIHAGMLKKGYVDPSTMQMNMRLMMGLPPSATTPAPTVSSPAGPAPIASTGGPILASNTTTTPLGSEAPASSTATTPSPSMPVPMQAPPARPKQINPAEAKMLMAIAALNRREPVMTQADALAAGSVLKGTKIVNPAQGNTDQKEQDAYWRDAVSGLRSIRGDTAMKDIESQRNSAISAYNRLSQIEMSGKDINPVDYVDILGQVYKARTGTAPTQEVLKEAKQQTAEGQFGKVYTYFSGQQMPATSKDIASSLKDMVAHMGLQADDLHDGYMQVHGSEVFNPNMNPKNVEKLSKISRGKTFAQATGIKPEDFDPHVQAIKWAQANPNDPRSPAILQKAMEAKSQGGQIGL